MRYLYIKITAITVLAALLVAGCAFLGSDVKGMREIKDAYARQFDKDIPACYKFTTMALYQWNAIIFQQNKNDYIIAMKLDSVFNSCIDTTELGILFMKTASGKTEVRVASLNKDLERFIAPRLFAYIEKNGDVSEEEELTPSTPINVRFKRQT